MLTETIIKAQRGDWTIPQNWERFTREEHAVWDLLFARQSEELKGRAVSDFFSGLDVLKLSKPGIPDFDELNERLFARTGWTVVSVPGLVPDDVFFEHLSKRRFPAGNFIRARGSLDYIEQPDVFHDVFGHVPLLAQPAVADFMQAMGAEGLAAIEHGALHRLSRLYWYSVEFGLAEEAGETRLYGAGLLSSFGEAHFALESPKPRRRPFEIERVLRTRYRSDAFQESYFVIPSFDALLGMLNDVALPELYDALEGQPDLDPA
ncbi:MAG: phenylalanine 4-monooxygenase [Alphaproteobacteria bacterium]|nr:MAG: phenylalanine 4-monooxygenase [Alphaproteobacteria bacterium]